MRILHTSDWHLGRTLHGVDLLAHQAAFLDHLVELAADARADAVVVAGDVYDRAVPPVEAVALLSDAVARLAEVAPVVITPGNHDSAVRLGFGAALMRDTVHVRARVADVGTPVLLPTPDGTLVVHPLPYLDPDAVRRDLVDPGADAPLARSHEAVTAAALRRVGADLAARRATDPGLRSVLSAHAFVVGGLPSDSERDIRVGGVDSVPAGVLGGWGLDYVALGHLHGPQVVPVPDVERPGQGEPVATVARYSGSPLAYSFSELHQRKSTAVVDLGAGQRRPGGAQVELVPAPVPRRLADVTGTLDELLGAAGAPHTDDWVRVVVTDAARPADLYARVTARFPHALQVHHRPPAVVTPGRAAEVVAGVDPVEVAHAFVAHVTGAPPDPAEAAVLRAAVEAVAAAERSA